MNKLFPLPICTFIKMVYSGGGIAVGNWKKVPGWLVKTILFEPLRWMEMALFNKRLRRHTITTPPVFILGYFRSGTSYLHELLTQDDRFGYHSNFQMIFPEIMLGCEKWMSPAFDFIFRLFRLQDPVHRVPLSLRFPGEEDGAMTTSLNPRGAAWGFFFPKMMLEYFGKYVCFENIPESEIKAWAQDYAFLVKKISLANREKPLVLKSPPNTARIKLLLSLYPDAKFIFIHRNPLEVYASNKRFMQVSQKLYGLGGVRALDMNAIILDNYARTMQRYLLDKHLIPPGHLVEIAYADFIADPVGTMRTTYATLNLDDFRYCEDKMESYAARQHEFVRLGHPLPPDEAKMAIAKLEPLIRQWDYPMQ